MPPSCSALVHCQKSAFFLPPPLPPSAPAPPHFFLPPQEEITQTDFLHEGENWSYGTGTGHFSLWTKNDQIMSVCCFCGHFLNTVSVYIFAVPSFSYRSYGRKEVYSLIHVVPSFCHIVTTVICGVITGLWMSLVEWLNGAILHITWIGCLVKRVNTHLLAEFFTKTLKWLCSIPAHSRQVMQSKMKWQTVSNNLSLLRADSTSFYLYQS